MPRQRHGSGAKAGNNRRRPAAPTLHPSTGQHGAGDPPEGADETENDLSGV